MKEKPIIFSGPMVRAILDGRKTQTRRIAKLRDDGHPKGAKYTPGDRLWVRENFYVQPGIWYGPPKNRGPQSIYYAADIPIVGVDGFVVRPSIYLPRWASRIALEMTECRSRRVQNITDADIVAEGFSCRNNFESYWCLLNGIESWDNNPWVWAYTFKVVKP